MSGPLVPIGALLTGGQSSRFGSDKALALLDIDQPQPEPGRRGQGAGVDEGQPAGLRRDDSKPAPSAPPQQAVPLTMGDRLVTTLREAGADPVVAIGGTAGHHLQIPVIPDLQPGLGPLAGLATALRWAGRGYVLVLPCDLPLIQSHHLLALVLAVQRNETRSSDGNPINCAAIATVDGEPQPTVGCWPASAGLSIQRAVKAGDRRMRRALDLVPWIGVEIDAFVMQDADDPATLRGLLSGLDNTTSPKSPPAT